MRETSNPVLNKLTEDNKQYGNSQVANYYRNEQASGTSSFNSINNKVITIDSVVSKTVTSLLVVMVSALISYFIVDNNRSLAGPLWLIGAIGSFSILIYLMFKPVYNAQTTLGYAIFEGLFVGAFSYQLSNYFASPAIIFQAILATFCVVAAMLFVYKNGVIRVTAKFTKVISTILFASLGLVLVDFVIYLFARDSSLSIRGTGNIAILFSIGMIILAAMFLLKDFDAVDQLVRAEAPDSFAWGIALSLMVSIIWLYTEILRLLAIFNRD